MKSEKKALDEVNSSLARRNLSLYCDFIRVVLDSNNYEEGLKLKILGLLRARKFGPIIELADSVCRAEHPTAREHYLANQLASLFKKVPFSSDLTGFFPEKAALEKFHSTERRVKRYNLRHRLRYKYGRGVPYSTLHNCAEWIRSVIGDSPIYELIWKECRFGPGASVGVSGNATHLAAKSLADDWSVTPAALPYALAAMRFNPHSWALLLKPEHSPYYSVDPVRYEQEFLRKCKLVDYNKIALVPKTAKVHRTIAVEPLLNGFIQNGVDSFLRRRLRRAGIDLKSQDRNRELARLGSIQDVDPYVTIDLSEASDSISKALVRSLLPPDWFHFLNSLRSPNFLLEGNKIPYEKFCSMGNGFCFPLETLIFSSVCWTVYNRHHRSADFSVYGDDIIVRQSLALEVLDELSKFGFKHNPEKTFLQGPFRESCGADWFKGEDVRPVTVTYLPDSLGDIFTLHNKTLRSWRTTAFFSEGRDYLRHSVPPRFRFVRPFTGNDDSAFQVERDLFMASPFARWDRFTWSWRWKELVSYSLSDKKYDSDHRFPAVLLQAALSGSKSESPFTKRRNTRTRMRFVSHHGGHSTWLPSIRFC